MKRGFTLVELIVVIAIIAILSWVVLASLNRARSVGDCKSGEVDACAKLPEDVVEKIREEGRETKQETAPVSAPTTEGLPAGVEKFMDGSTTCYTYRSASISCVR